MKQHRSLEGLSLFSWAKAGKKCQALVFLFILFFYLTKQYVLPWCSNLPNNFLLTPKFYSRLAELATYKQTLADGAISNAKICAWSPLVLKEVHWILKAEDAQGASNPMPLHAPAQASQGHAAEGQGAEPHMPLLQKNPSRDLAVLCNSGR